MQDKTYDMKLTYWEIRTILNLTSDFKSDDSKEILKMSGLVNKIFDKLDQISNDCTNPLVGQNNHVVLEISNEKGEERK